MRLRLEATLKRSQVAGTPSYRQEGGRTGRTCSVEHWMMLEVDQRPFNHVVAKEPMKKSSNGSRL